MALLDNTSHLVRGLCLADFGLLLLVQVLQINAHVTLSASMWARKCLDLACTASDGPTLWTMQDVYALAETVSFLSSRSSGTVTALGG